MAMCVNPLVTVLITVAGSLNDEFDVTLGCTAHCFLSRCRYNAGMTTFQGRKIEHIGSTEWFKVATLLTEALEGVDKNLQDLTDAGNVHASEITVTLEIDYHGERYIVHMEDTWAEFSRVIDSE